MRQSGEAKASCGGQERPLVPAKLGARRKRRRWRKLHIIHHNDHHQTPDANTTTNNGTLQLRGLVASTQISKPAATSLGLGIYPFDAIFLLLILILLVCVPHTCAPLLKNNDGNQQFADNDTIAIVELSDSPATQTVSSLMINEPSGGKFKLKRLGSGSAAPAKNNRTGRDRKHALESESGAGDDGRANSSTRAATAAPADNSGLSMSTLSPEKRRQLLEQEQQRRLMEIKQKYMTNRAISDRAYYILLVIYSLFIIVGTTSNALICLTVILKPTILSPRNIFIVNLAGSDLLLCVFTMPFSFIEISMKMWHMGLIPCKLVAGLQATSIFVSTISITAIALDRYKVIVYPTHQEAASGTRGAFLLLASVWFGALLLSSPLFRFRTVEHIALPHFDDSIKSLDYCVEAWPFAHGRGIYSVISMIFQYVLPITIVSVVYAKISDKLQKRLIRRQRSTQLECQQKRQLNLIKRTHTMLISVSLIFGLSWLPLNLLNVLGDFSGIDSLFNGDDQLFRVVFAICHLIGCSSACSNPILYGYLNENFRKEFHQVYTHYAHRILRHLRRMWRQIRATCRGHVAGAGGVGGKRPPGESQPGNCWCGCCAWHAAAYIPSTPITLSARSSAIDYDDDDEEQEEGDDDESSEEESEPDSSAASQSTTPRSGTVACCSANVVANEQDRSAYAGEIQPNGQVKSDPQAIEPKTSAAANQNRLQLLGERNAAAPQERKSSVQQVGQQTLGRTMRFCLCISGSSSTESIEDSAIRKGSPKRRRKERARKSQLKHPPIRLEQLNCPDEHVTVNRKSNSARKKRRYRRAGDNADANDGQTTGIVSLATPTSQWPCECQCHRQSARRRSTLVKLARTISHRKGSILSVSSPSHQLAQSGEVNQESDMAPGGGGGGRRVWLRLFPARRSAPERGGPRARSAEAQLAATGSTTERVRDNAPLQSALSVSHCHNCKHGSSRSKYGSGRGARSKGGTGSEAKSKKAKAKARRQRRGCDKRDQVAGQIIASAASMDNIKMSAAMTCTSHQVGPGDKMKPLESSRSTSVSRTVSPTTPTNADMTLTAANSAGKSSALIAPGTIFLSVDISDQRRRAGSEFSLSHERSTSVVVLDGDLDSADTNANVDQDEVTGRKLAHSGEPDACDKRAMQISRPDSATETRIDMTEASMNKPADKIVTRQSGACQTLTSVADQHSHNTVVDDNCNNIGDNTSRGNDKPSEAALADCRSNKESIRASDRVINSRNMADASAPDGQLSDPKNELQPAPYHLNQCSDSSEVASDETGSDLCVSSCSCSHSTSSLSCLGHMDARSLNGSLTGSRLHAATLTTANGAVVGSRTPLSDNQQHGSSLAMASNRAHLRRPTHTVDAGQTHQLTGKTPLTATCSASTHSSTTTTSSNNNPTLTTTSSCNSAVSAITGASRSSFSELACLSGSVGADVGATPPSPLSSGSAVSIDNEGVAAGEQSRFKKLTVRKNSRQPPIATLNEFQQQEGIKETGNHCQDKENN